MLNIPRRGDYQIRRIENLFVILSCLFVAECFDCFRSSGDIQSQRMTRKKSLAKDLAKILLGRILDHLHFLNDDPLFAFEIGFIKTGVNEHVGDQVKCLCNLVVDDFDRKAGFLVRGKSIQIATDKMRDAVQLDGLVP